MKISPKDFEETRRLAAVIAKIDHIDAKYANETSDEIFQKQPFFLTVLLGCRLDVFLFSTLPIAYYLLPIFSLPIANCLLPILKHRGALQV